MFRQDCTCPALLFVAHRSRSFVYRAITCYGQTFQTVRLDLVGLPRLGWSPFARHYSGNLG